MADWHGGLAGGSPLPRAAGYVLDHHHAPGYPLLTVGDRATVRQLVTVVPFILALTACAPQPFDATSPWQPLSDPGEGRAYRGGQMAEVPSNVFDEFEPDARSRQNDTPSGPQSRVPDPRSGENPWATIPRNPVVTV